MLKGRFLKVFLPVITGLILVVSSVLAFNSNISAGDDYNECEEYEEYEEYEYEWDEYEDCEEPTPTPTPTPTPEPCPEDDLIDDWDFWDLEYDHEPSPTPCPTPTPTPTPTPEPTQPPVGGGQPSGGGEGGANPPRCPEDAKPQDIDQVWISDVTPTSLIVHWANKGDETGYQVSYGPENNKYQWGIKVGNVNHLEIKEIPAGLKVVVSVIPLNGDCAGNPTQAGPSVLAAAGTTGNLPMFAGGFSLITLGLWQAQKSLRLNKKA